MRTFARHPASANLLLAAKTSGWCWREGIGTARLVSDHLGARAFPAPNVVAYHPDPDLRHLAARFDKAVGLSPDWAVTGQTP